MNFAELKQAVSDIVLDSSPNIVAAIPSYINEAIWWATNEVQIPSLKQLMSVSTSITYYYISLLTSYPRFSGKLLYAGNSDGEFTIVNEGLRRLIELFPGLTDTGSVSHVALEGNILYYQGKPSVAETITLLGYNDPVVLSSETDIPSEIPLMLHREVIVYKAVELAYTVIEDAMEDKTKVNTLLFRSLADAGMARFQAWVSKRRTTVGSSVWSV